MRSTTVVFILIIISTLFVKILTSDDFDDSDYSDEIETTYLTVPDAPSNHHTESSTIPPTYNVTNSNVTWSSNKAKKELTAYSTDVNNQESGLITTKTSERTRPIGEEFDTNVFWLRSRQPTYQTEVLKNALPTTKNSRKEQTKWWSIPTSFATNSSIIEISTKAKEESTLSYLNNKETKLVTIRSSERTRSTRQINKESDTNVFWLLSRQPTYQTEVWKNSFTTTETSLKNKQTKPSTEWWIIPTYNTVNTTSSKAKQELTATDLNNKEREPVTIRSSDRPWSTSQIDEESNSLTTTKYSLRKQTELLTEMRAIPTSYNGTDGNINWLLNKTEEEQTTYSTDVNNQEREATSSKQTGSSNKIDEEFDRFWLLFSQLIYNNSVLTTENSVREKQTEPLREWNSEILYIYNHSSLKPSWLNENISTLYTNAEETEWLDFSTTETEFNTQKPEASTPWYFTYTANTYRNYGYTEETENGWLITLLDTDEEPCMKMNLQIIINVYFQRDFRLVAFLPTLPTTPHDFTIEGECNENNSSLLLISWKNTNMTWYFQQDFINDTWSLNKLELSVRNPDWFEKYNFCASPCEDFSFTSSTESPWWYNSDISCQMVSVPLSHYNTDLKGTVVLIDGFHVEPFFRNGSDLNPKLC